MSKPNEERDIYYIPPNFLASGRLFGGMIRARNAIEACVLVLLTGIPIIKLPMSLTVRIIILCLLPLPLGIFGIIGFEGDSLSEFAINWVRWFIHRRNLYRSDVTIPETARKQKKRIWEQEATKPPEELGIRIKQPLKKRKRPAKTEKQLNKNNRKMVPSHKKQVTYSEDFVPVKDIRNGIIEMEDGRYIRVLEVEPINFLLRSTSEQKNIVASFASWMKISPIKIQIKVLTKKADIGKHLSTIERDMESESNPKCRELQLDYYRLIQTIGSREAITRRFLVIFEYEAVTNRKPEYSEIVSALETTVQTARQYFLHCDNAVVTHDDENAFLLEILYTIFNRSTCEVRTVEQRIGELQLARRDTDITVPVSLKSVLAPDSIDLTHGSYVVMDGVYHAYLIVPSDGYNPRVVAGWTSILVNAGEGIDVDFYFSREPKERIQAKLGQQIRINRSRLKDTSDTNSDFDDFESAIRSGYFLKEGLANYEDFYYCNTLVTVTADTLENLEWRISEVRRLMISQDMDIRICRFRQEQALLSILPFCKLDKKLFEASKRNMLTSSAASCYPFTSFEMSDENGILLGVNQHNNSLVIVDMSNAAGAVLLISQKPSLMSPAKRATNAVVPDPNKIYYYAAHELRVAIEEYSPESVSKSSRTIGIIVKGRCCFFLYFTGSTRMYWMKNSEENYAAAVKSLLLARGFGITSIHQIVIGSTMSVAQRLCHGAKPFGNKYFVVSTFFAQCLFLTNNKEGDTLLKLILHDELTMEINRAALSPFHPPRIPTREYDAIETSLDRPVLLNYQCDLLMLSDIHPMPEGFRGSPIMLCFDYQTQVIQRIVGPAIEVRPLESRLDYG